MPLVAVSVAVLFVALVAWLASRATEAFCVSVRAGRCLVVRGRVPVGLRQDIEEVVRRAGVERAEIRAVRESGALRLTAAGVDGRVEQRLRNVVGAYGHDRIRRAPRARGRNLGQWLGWTWLAWALSRRSWPRP